QYGGLRDDCALPASFYELATRVEGRGVYSFCMCPGGFVVPASTESSRVVVNGMSLSRRDPPFANPGPVVPLQAEDWGGERGPAGGGGGRGGGRAPAPRAAVPLCGTRLQRALERRASAAGGGGNRAPSQRADLFVEGGGRTVPPLATSYRPGLAACDLA